MAEPGVAFSFPEKAQERAPIHNEEDDTASTQTTTSLDSTNCSSFTNPTDGTTAHVTVQQQDESDNPRLGGGGVVLLPTVERAFVRGSAATVVRVRCAQRHDGTQANVWHRNDDTTTTTTSSTTWKVAEAGA